MNGWLIPGVVLLAGVLGLTIWSFAHHAVRDPKDVPTASVSPSPSPPTAPGPDPYSNAPGTTNWRELLLARALTATQQGELSVALSLLHQVERYYPDDLVVVKRLGSLYAMLGRPKLAVWYWQRALAKDPEDETLRRLLERWRTYPMSRDRWEVRKQGGRK